MNFLCREYREGLKILEQDLLPVKETGWYRKMQKRTKPGDAIRVYRQNQIWKITGGMLTNRWPNVWLNC